MINILDQVSGLQSPACHERVKNRVLALLDLQLRDLAHAMVDEASARARLGEFPHVLHFDKLQNVNLTGELFWRSLLQAAARCTLSKLGAKTAAFSYKMLFSTGKLRNKLQIAIPANLGRSMLGVIDETGILQYGQIYVRYTLDARQKRPRRSALRRTVVGDVLVTKNPMIVAVSGAANIRAVRFTLVVFILRATCACLRRSMCQRSSISAT